MSKSALDNATHRKLQAKYAEFFEREAEGRYPEAFMFVDVRYGHMNHDAYKSYTTHTGFVPGLVEATLAVLSPDAMAQLLGGVKWLLEHGWQPL